MSLKKSTMAKTSHGNHSEGGVSEEDANKVTIKSLLGHSPDFGDGLMMLKVIRRSRYYEEHQFQAQCLQELIGVYEV